MMPAGEKPFCSRISASASAVPDDAYAAVQWLLLKSRAIASTSARATVSAAANAAADSAPSRKKRCVMPTQPILSESSPQRIHAAADDELGRAAADVDDQPRLARGRQHVRDAEVDEPRLLVAGDDVDRVARGRARPGAGNPRRSSRPSACWCPRRAPPTGGCPAGARRSGRGRRAPPVEFRPQVAVGVDARAQPQRSRERCPAGTPGRPRRDRPPAGSCWTPCRRRRASWR